MHFFFRSFVRLLLNFGSIESGRVSYVAEEDSFWGFDPCLFALSSFDWSRANAYTLDAFSAPTKIDGIEDFDLGEK